MKTKWNATKYTNDFSFVTEYGKDLINLIKKEKGSSLLDLGCGNGKLTNTLKEEGYLVTGLDSSNELLKLANENYPSITFIEADATDFKLKEPVDVIFSNAVFHWIKKPQQEKLIQNIYNNLKTGGELIFECGGFGNNKIIHKSMNKVFKKHNLDYEIPFYFPSIGEYANLLEKAGFLVVYAILFDRPTQLKGEDGLKDWIEMFLREPLNLIEDDNLKNQILTEAVDDMKSKLFINNQWFSDYVRLRMKAIKP